MEVEQILRAFGIILGAGLISQLISTFLRIPEMIVLVAVGALIGPSVLGIVSNPLDGAGAQLIFTIGVSMILFDGGTGIFAAGDLANRHGARPARAAGRTADGVHRRPGRRPGFWCCFYGRPDDRRGVGRHRPRHPHT